MHCDETDDPLSRHVETLAAETVRLGLQGRVVGSHLTSMHSMDNYYVSKLIPLMAEADLGVIANPFANMVLQGRHDTYPKRRGMTRVPELMAAGLTVALGHDSVMDPWYGLGSGDMLDVAHMAVHVAQMTGLEAMAACFAAVTENAARAAPSRRVRPGARLPGRHGAAGRTRSRGSHSPAGHAAESDSPGQSYRRNRDAARVACAAGSARRSLVPGASDQVVIRAQ